MQIKRQCQWYGTILRATLGLIVAGGWLWAAAHPNPLDVLSSNPKKQNQTQQHPAQKKHPKIVIETMDVNAVGAGESVEAASVMIQPIDDGAIVETEVVGAGEPSQAAAVGMESRSDPTRTSMRPSAPTPKKSKKTQQRTRSPHHPPTRVLYLTFDDGPLRGTDNLLRVIQEERIRATLFFIGRRIQKDPDLFHKALATPEVLVANHTYSHANEHYRRFYTGSIRKVVQDIDRAQTLIGGAKYLRLCGRNVWRLPHVRRNDWAISVAQRHREIDKYDALANRGYFIFGWDIEWRFDPHNQRPVFGGEEMARRVNVLYRSGKTIQKNAVVLLAHDFMWQSRRSVQQLRIFVRIMKAQGWVFETIDRFSAWTPETYASRSQGDKQPTKRPVAAKLSPRRGTPAHHPRRVSKKRAKAASPGRLEMVAQLNEAIAHQDFIGMRRLIARGAQINRRDLQGHLPLNVAIRTNNAVLVRMLVERGANLFSVDGDGMSPMGLARQINNTIIVRYLARQIEKQKKLRLHRPMFTHEGFSPSFL